MKSVETRGFALVETSGKYVQPGFLKTLRVITKVVSTKMCIYQKQSPSKGILVMAVFTFSINLDFV